MIRGMTANLNTYASRPIVMVPGASKLVGIDMKGIFPAGGLTGTPVVTCVSATQTYAAGATVATGDISFGGPIVNAGSYVSDSGRTVAVGEGVQVQVNAASGVDGGNYLLHVFATDGTTSDGVYCLIEVRGTNQSAP